MSCIHHCVKVAELKASGAEKKSAEETGLLRKRGTLHGRESKSPTTDRNFGMWGLTPVRKTPPKTTKGKQAGHWVQQRPHAVPQITPGNTSHWNWSKRLSSSCLLDLNIYPISTSSPQKSSICWRITGTKRVRFLRHQHASHLPQLGGGH